MRNTQPNGFTLVEIVMTIVLLTIISAIAAVIILQGVKGYTAEDARSNIHYQARLAVERMARELRTVQTPTALGTVALGTITGNPTSSLIFTDVTGTNITYSLAGTTLTRTSGGTASTLAAGVTTLQFRHYDNTGVLTTSAAAVWTIEITMTDTQGSESLPIRTRVHPRNF